MTCQRTGISIGSCPFRCTSVLGLTPRTRDRPRSAASALACTAACCSAVMVLGSRTLAPGISLAPAEVEVEVEVEVEPVTSGPQARSAATRPGREPIMSGAPNERANAAGPVAGATKEEAQSSPPKRVTLRDLQRR